MSGSDFLLNSAVRDVIVYWPPALKNTRQASEKSMYIYMVEITITEF
jgi:hypothetical protein